MNAGTARKLVGWSDYRRWDDDRRWEIIGGEAYDMTPAPLVRHQEVVLNLGMALKAAFRGRKCRPFLAPIDVKLSEADILQPDLVVVCDPDQIKETHIEGAPTLVVEVSSPSTASHDRIRKLGVYARAGVMEVWLVTPYPHIVEVLALDGASYRLVGTYDEKGTLASPNFPDLKLELAPVFDFPIPPEERIEMVKEATPPGYGAGERERDSRGAAEVGWGPRMGINCLEAETLRKVGAGLHALGAIETLLYGSAARGTLDAESDLDLFVVFRENTPQVRRRTNDICFEAGLECDRLISTVCFTEDELRNSPLRSSPLVLNAKREGIAL